MVQKIKRLMANLIGNSVERYLSPNVLHDNEPFMLIGASDSLAPSIIEELALLKLRVNEDYESYRNLNKLAKIMRKWKSTHPTQPTIINPNKEL